MSKLTAEKAFAEYHQMFADFVRGGAVSTERAMLLLRRLHERAYPGNTKAEQVERHKSLVALMVQFWPDDQIDIFWTEVLKMRADVLGDDVTELLTPAKRQAPRKAAAATTASTSARSPKSPTGEANGTAAHATPAAAPAPAQPSTTTQSADAAPPPNKKRSRRSQPQTTPADDSSETESPRSAPPGTHGSGARETGTRDPAAREARTAALVAVVDDATEDWNGPADDGSGESYSVTATEVTEVADDPDYDSAVWREDAATEPSDDDEPVAGPPTADEVELPPTPSDDDEFEGDLYSPPTDTAAVADEHEDATDDDSPDGYPVTDDEGVVPYTPPGLATGIEGEDEEVARDPRVWRKELERLVDDVVEQAYSRYRANRFTRGAVEPFVTPASILLTLRGGEPGQEQPPELFELPEPQQRQEVVHAVNRLKAAGKILLRRSLRDGKEAVHICPINADDPFELK